MSFAGFSEEDLQRIKSTETNSNNGPTVNPSAVNKLAKIGLKPKKISNQYKLTGLQHQNSDDAIDSIDFAKCKLSLRSPTSPVNEMEPVNSEEEVPDNDLFDVNDNVSDLNLDHQIKEADSANFSNNTSNSGAGHSIRKYSTDSAPDIVRGVTDYTEDELANHRMKLEELQLQQRIMEEQNKKRKEMLAKALADRTKQTEEEVLKLEKIKKELQVLDGQFSQDVSVLRKKIDQACWSYAEAEKHYLKVEKEFLQAKINLQKEKEKKELLTEHLCALITHNETRKAQKLETLMLELATDKKKEINEYINSSSSIEDDEPVIIDGVDQRTGKIVEMPAQT